MWCGLFVVSAGRKKVSTSFIFLTSCGKFRSTLVILCVPGETEISQFDVIFRRDKDIFTFDVSMSNVHLVQVHQSHNQISGPLLHNRLFRGAVVSDEVT